MISATKRIYVSIKSHISKNTTLYKDVVKAATDFGTAAGPGHSFTILISVEVGSAIVDGMVIEESDSIAVQSVITQIRKEAEEYELDPDDDIPF